MFDAGFSEIIKKESDAFKKYKKNCTIAQRSNAIFVNTDTDRIDLKRDKREEMVLVYKCGQEKLNNLYYQMKEQRR